MKPASPQQPRTLNARFTSGSILRHVISMTAATSIGLMSIFFVELADMYFISLLGEEALAAAVGFSGAITFFVFSISIGLSIGLAAVVARVIGEGRSDQAKRTVFNGLVVSFVLMGIIALPVFFYTRELLMLVGAEGQALVYGIRYMQIIVPSLPVIAIGMSMGAVLRAIGEAKASMISTVAAGVINALLDPFLIFTLDMHIEGAATATLIARLVMVIIAAVNLGRYMGVSVFWPQGGLYHDILAISRIALPASLTSLATPFANSYVTTSVAHHGSDAVAGLAIISRIIPFAFGAVFALSAAIGPIVGQNIGAGATGRVQDALKSSLLVITGVVFATSTLLALSARQIGELFSVTGLSAELVGFFCIFVSWSFVFTGAQFIANATFNNINLAPWSTFANWGKATLGTVPFIWLGDYYAGAKGIIAGQAIGAVIFGTISFIVAYRVVKRPVKEKGPQYFGAMLPAVLSQFGWQRFLEERWRVEEKKRDK
ncbi:MATE family efflux transporter [Kiloniella laminariae]|uniref:MATE family efflux transporter n=1 Tax=Kiloniella laminariae TaxID=454162 RepID=UPI0003A533C8|nr:MATE family efflux transporter [Kiloniella laminariae]